MKKSIAIIVVFMLVIINIYLFMISNFNEKKYIIIDEKNIFEYKNNSFKKIDKSVLKKLNYSDTNLFINNKMIQKVNFDIKDSTLIYDNTKEIVNYSNKKILSNIEYNLKVKEPVSTEDIKGEDEEIMDSILKENLINRPIDSLGISKIDLSENKKIFNIYPLDLGKEYDVDPYIIALVNDEDIIYIEKNINKKIQSSQIYVPNLHLAFDINNDNNYEIVVSYSKTLDINSTYYCVFKYDSLTNKFKDISNCK